jgi:hypothetical protein
MVNSLLSPALSAFAKWQIRAQVWSGVKHNPAKQGLGRVGLLCVSC